MEPLFWTFQSAGGTLKLMSRIIFSILSTMYLCKFSQNLAPISEDSVQKSLIITVFIGQ